MCLELKSTLVALEVLMTSLKTLNQRGVWGFMKITTWKLGLWALKEHTARVCKGTVPGQQYS